MKTIDLLAQHGWDYLDPVDDDAFLERVESALRDRDRDALAAAIWGGGTLGGTLETADELLAAYDDMLD